MELEAYYAAEIISLTDSAQVIDGKIRYKEKV